MHAPDTSLLGATTTLHRVITQKINMNIDRHQNLKYNKDEVQVILCQI
jgi:hypothetical protein